MNPSRNDPSELDANESKSKELPECPRCAMASDRWTANEGQGFEKDDQLYCCEGCAEDTGCICEETRSSQEDQPKDEESSTVPRSGRFR